MFGNSKTVATDTVAVVDKTSHVNGHDWAPISYAGLRLLPITGNSPATNPSSATLMLSTMRRIRRRWRWLRRSLLCKLRARRDGGVVGRGYEGW